MCRVPRVRFHEIILLTEIKKDDAAQKPRMIFFFREQPANLRATVTNGPLWRQFNMHTVKLEASIAFWWNHSRASETNYSSSASIPSRVFQGNHFFPLCWDFKPSVSRWIGSMCLWPLCFMVTCQAFCARGACWKNAASVLRIDCTRPPGQESGGGWLELSTPVLFLERTHPQRMREAAHACWSGPTHIAASASTQWEPSCMLISALEWGIVFNCVVLHFSAEIIVGY